MLPEQIARQNIDNQLQQCGWLVQDRDDMNIMAGVGVAVREFPLRTGFADYLLYLDGKAAGVIEAKPEGHSLTGVEIQSAKYTSGLPKTVPHYSLPLPFAWESTGKDTRFTNTLEPNARSREVFSFHRPEELLRLVRQESQLRENLRDMPELDTTGLWDVQVRAITNLEKSLSDNKPKALVQMATGSGKTFTAVSSRYCGNIIRIGPLYQTYTQKVRSLRAFWVGCILSNVGSSTPSWPVGAKLLRTTNDAGKVALPELSRHNLFYGTTRAPGPEQRSISRESAMT